MVTKPNPLSEPVATTGSTSVLKPGPVGIQKPQASNIADASALAQALLITESARAHADGERFDQIAQNEYGLIRRLFLSAEEKAVLQKQRLRMEIQGKVRLEKLRMAHECELGVLACVGDALVKSARLGVATDFYNYAQAKLNELAINTEKHRKRFAEHIHGREQTLATLSPRLRGPYEASIDAEIETHLRSLDAATAELLAKLNARAISYAGNIES